MAAESLLLMFSSWKSRMVAHTKHRTAEFYFARGFEKWPPFYLRTMASWRHRCPNLLGYSGLIRVSFWFFAAVIRVVTQRFVERDGPNNGCEDSSKTISFSVGCKRREMYMCRQPGCLIASFVWKPVQLFSGDHVGVPRRYTNMAAL